MSRKYAAESAFTTLYIVESLEGERHTGKYLADDLAATFSVEGLEVQHLVVKDRVAFIAALFRIMDECSQGKLPVLHLEIHGDQEGLTFLPSGEKMTWDEFASRSKEVNRVTYNRLFVTMAVCYGFTSILKVSIHDVSPFFALLGAEHDVFGYEVDNFPKLFRALLNEEDLTEVLKEFPSFKIYLCEQLFINSYLRYARKVVGKQRRLQRVEDLTTKARAHVPELLLNTARILARQHARPERESFERMRNRFLMADSSANSGRFSVTWERVNEITEGWNHLQRKRG